jgi:murein DD-endopeptidase MepM/ murein hydrolase activator NlpD
MNRAITLMMMTSGKRNVRQVVLHPVALWLSLGGVLVLFAAGIWGAAHVYGKYSEARTLRVEYEALLMQNGQLTANYREMEQRLHEIERLETGIRHVLGMPQTPSSSADVSTIAQGGVSARPDEWHGLALDSGAFAAAIKVPKEYERNESIPLGVDSLARAQKVLAELTEIQRVTARELADMGTMPTITPIQTGEPYWIASRFGLRVSPFTGKYEFHRGLDIAARKGAAVVAAADGVVAAMWPETTGDGYGNAVKLQHGEHYVTIYAHLRHENPFPQGLRVGAKVRRNQIIGYVGSTGRSTSPHLHYEVMRDDVSLNPEQFLLDR